ncbi:MAG: T9SS type A sorting domain-containing protein [Bacteroidales bacterium]|nr:T9SS type A sorting domain-containing protein [Bacteroidales bacterium]
MKKNVFFLSLVMFAGLSIWQANAQISATSTGGGSGSYSTLKAAFDDVNAGVLTGDVTLQVTASTSETATASLSASGTGAASYTSVVIYPTSADLSILADGTLPASSHLIVLDGADNVTIDGRVNQSGARDNAHSLTIASTSLTAATIVLQSDASTNTIKNCILKGNATSSKGIVWIASSATLGNNSNLIDNNLITNNGTRPLYAFYASNNTLTAPNTNNTIRNNDFQDCLPYGAGCMVIFVAGHASSVISTGWTISGNSFYETATYTTTNGASAAINFINFGTSGTTSTGDGNVISGNYFGGTATHCGGGTFTKTSSTSFANNFSGINVYSITGTTTSIQNNTFQKISWTNNTGSSNWRAIDVYGTGSFNIGTETGNTIGDNTTTGSIVFVTNVSTAVNASVFPIQIGNTGTTVCKNNKIGSITASNTIAAATNVSPIAAITKASGAGIVEISNNMIGSLSTANSISSALSTSGSETTGIKCYSSVTGNKIENNTIANLSSGGSTGLINGIMTGNTGTTTVNANLIHSLFSSSNSNGAQVTGIYLNTTTNTVCTNNIIALSAIENGTAQTQVCGFQEQSSAAATKLYHNTVYIYGTVDAGTRRSACYYSVATGATSNRDIRNNIFMNARTGGGSHSAINFATTANGTILSNYNDIYSATASSICVYNSGGKTLAQWQALALPVTGGSTYAPDANSISQDPVFYNAGGTTALSYSVVPSLTGTPIATVPTDFSGVTRSGSTPSMGAFENNSIITKLNDINENNTRIIRNSDGIVVNFDGRASIELYSMSGKLIERTNAVGSYNRKLESGAYIIRVNGKSSKFIK